MDISAPNSRGRRAVLIVAVLVTFGVSALSSVARADYHADVVKCFRIETTNQRHSCFEAAAAGRTPQQWQYREVTDAMTDAAEPGAKSGAKGTTLTPDAIALIHEEEDNHK